MFDDLSKSPEDIFEKTDEAAPHVAPPTAPPVVSSEQVLPSQPLQPLSPLQPSATTPLQPSSSGGHIKTVIIIVAILVVIGGAFLISWRILSSRTPVTPQEPTEEVKEAVTEGFSLPEVTQPEVVQPEVDTDKDGLSDLQEAQLGTSPKSSAPRSWNSSAGRYLRGRMTSETSSPSEISGAPITRSWRTSSQSSAMPPEESRS